MSVVKEALKYSILTALTICIVFLIGAIFYLHSPSMQKGMAMFYGGEYVPVTFSKDSFLSYLGTLGLMFPVVTGIIFVFFIIWYKEEENE